MERVCVRGSPAGRDAGGTSCRMSTATTSPIVTRRAVSGRCDTPSTVTHARPPARFTPSRPHCRPSLAHHPWRVSGASMPASDDLSQQPRSTTSTELRRLPIKPVGTLLIPSQPRPRRPPSQSLCNDHTRTAATKSSMPVGATSARRTIVSCRHPRECPRKCVGTNERDVHAYNGKPQPWLDPHTPIDPSTIRPGDMP